MGARPSAKILARRSFEVIPLVLAALALALAPSPAIARTVAVSEKDNGGECILARGDTLAVSLEARSGTGYVWQVARIDGSILKSAGDPKFELKGESAPGAAWNQTFRFSAESAGNSALELVYLRPWEKGTPPAGQFTINVMVK